VTWLARRRLSALPIALWAAVASAAEPEADGGVRFAGAPFARYAPEIRWGFGAIGLLWFHADPEARASGRASAVGLAAQYSTRRQAVGGAQWDLYLGQGTWRASGTLLGERWPYDYWGVGEAAGEPAEPYTARTARLEASLLRLVVPRGEGQGLWLGLRAAARDDRIGGLAADGALAACAVEGCRGGRTSLLQLSAAWDTRDHVFAPARGLFLSARAGGAAAALGSDVSFAEAELDARGYAPVPLLPGAVLALQLRLHVTGGDVPFYLLPTFGGDRSLRGIVDGRHRDRTSLLVQGELAIPLVWRLGLELFGGAGEVAPRPSRLALSRLVPAGGLGLRLWVDPADRVFLRLDHGWGPGSSHWYLSIGQNL